MKFADNEANINVIQEGKPLFNKIRGRWNEAYFKNQNDIALELACGRGEYTTGLATLFPKKNFIGIDIKGARIWTGSQYAAKMGLRNVGFLRTNIQNIDDFFSENEISEIWIIHPDPRPKDSDERRRITNNRFLNLYKKIIKLRGLLHLKTDNTELYEYSLETLDNRQDIHILSYTDDLYHSKMMAEHYNINTRYEQEFTAEGNMIKYIKFSFINHD